MSAPVRPLDSRKAAPEPLPEPICLLNAPAATPIKYLADGFLLDRELSFFVGDSASYKTTVMLAIAAAVASGQPVLGRFPLKWDEPAPVLIVSEEDGLAVIQNRINALIAGLGFDRITTLEHLHVLALEGARLEDPFWQAHLRAEHERLGIRLSCWDPLADLLSGNESDPSAARPVIRFWRRLAAEGSAVLALHHLGKPKEGQSRVHQVRGASSWANAARAVYALERRDAGVWLTCEKLSRAERLDPIELELEIEADKKNPATWVKARVTAAHPAGDWRVTDRRSLTASERKGLGTLDRHRDESLFWSRWLEISGLKSSSLSEAMPRLLDLGYVRKEAAGMYAGRPRFSYQITAAGSNALLPSPDSANSGSTPSQHRPELGGLNNGNSGSTTDQRRAESPNLNSATPSPPLGGTGAEELGLPGELDDSNSGPGLEVPSDGYLQVLISGGPLVTETAVRLLRALPPDRGITVSRLVHEAAIPSAYAWRDLKDLTRGKAITVEGVVVRLTPRGQEILDTLSQGRAG